MCPVCTVTILAGFYHGHCTCDQVTALMMFTENRFEKMLKTGAVFLDGT